MTQAQIEIQLIAALTAAACALPGAFLVLRRMAMLSDAISHTVLFGIVAAFFITRDLNSPLLLVGAALTGLLTVSLVELLLRTGRVREDAAVGLVFPVLFSIAVILISRSVGNIHLDTDAVLLGELAFAPFDRLSWNGLDFGPAAAWKIAGITVLNLVFILVFYKELKLATFDPALAAALGFAPAALHYGLTGLVSLTAVGAFDAVGSVLVVALMIAPPATAYLLTDSLPRLLGLSVVTGVAGALAGYWTAHWLDISLAGSMAGMCGVLFGLAWLFAPRRGLVSQARRRARQRWQFAQAMLIIHLRNHEGTPQAHAESQVEHLGRHMRWSGGFTAGVIQRAVQRGWVNLHGETLLLTEQGRQQAQQEITA